MHIINFLGLSGELKVNYGRLEELNLNETNNKYFNTTQLLLEHFHSKATFSFIGTKESIQKQHELLKEYNYSINILEYSKKINEHEPSLIFNTILEIIKEHQNDYIILDITHGFRTLPLIASFGSIFGKINYTNKIKIIFAQENIKGKQYDFISLDRYLDISVLAVSLDTFSKTLNLIKNHYTDDLILALESFSHSLHANAFKKLFKENLIEAKKQINIAKANEFYQPLNNILCEIENILNYFESIKDKKEYEKYFYIAKIMFEKNYYLASTTYIFEGLSKYILEHFKELKILRKNQENSYDNSQAINNFILNNNANNKIFIYCKAKFYKNKYKAEFDTIYKLLTDIKNLRNNLAHISQELEDNIKQNLSKIIKDFKTHIIDNKILPYYNLDNIYDDFQLAQDIKAYIENKIPTSTNLPKDLKSWINFSQNYKKNKNILQNFLRVEHRKDISLLDNSLKPILNCLYLYQENNTCNIKQEHYEKIITIIGKK
ncbi:CRISPR-associated protein [Campylobacter lari]|uniref:TM1812 family CRISPR-associated protein n=1 Tax=Campylobacter lari TaxID=201 RepID=UPI0021529886|nr:TM1812 family CRISPR-associated protein [Campylobacter lari]MCR6558557.1 TM1812 family CRISPR-associated protein [Campylobacter lari]MCR6776926.1 TM1812 family CRISPR-associated protein [Campylobacter lari]MCV3405149.1 TM1812 family CRISPR-associated protein [Campylobacter lari]MCV3430022.1 TM1812 family CRISPR-associated protein [Campylobacter lari]